VGIKDLLSIASALLGTRERIILGFIGGLLIGLLILGWWLWPVQWKDAAPADLEQSYRQTYLDTVARLSETDASVDVSRMLGGDSWSADRLQRDLNQAYADATDNAVKTRLSGLGNKLDIAVTGEVPEQAGRSIGGVLAVFLIVLIGGSSAFVLLRLRQQGAAMPVTVGGDPDKVAAARSRWDEEEAPMAEFVTSYALGEDFYDQSFSIETRSGEFLGECGVGISEAIGVGDPKKVTAFEVWLFDKNDIRTVTKVLMTEHCFQDDALRAKLAAKGEAAMGGEGAIIDLSTASLRVQAKVIEMEYGVGNLPPNSFVTRLTIELAAWQLEGAGGDSDSLPTAF
jgi:tetrahydromethanopterin S-methyltransferase subunit G